MQPAGESPAAKGATRQRARPLGAWGPISGPPLENDRCSIFWTFPARGPGL